MIAPGESSIHCPKRDLQTRVRPQGRDSCTEALDFLLEAFQIVSACGQSRLVQLETVAVDYPLAPIAGVFLHLMPYIRQQTEGILCQSVISSDYTIMCRHSRLLVRSKRPRLNFTAVRAY